MFETCRISFQNKFEKLVHLVGFIIKIYHDARIHERQITKITLTTTIQFLCTPCWRVELSLSSALSGGERSYLCLNPCSPGDEV